MEEKYTRRRYQASYVTTLISITLVLFMLGILGMIVLHAKKLSNHVKENIGFRVFIKDNIKEADIIQLQKILDTAPYVKTTEYITPEDAARQLSQDLGEDFIEFLGYNPLPPAIDLRLKADYANIDSITVIEKNLAANKIVKEVYYQKSLVEVINQNIQKISFVLLAFSALLLLISIALISNTIRLSVYAKRFIIRSMQLVGATQSFIRRPFIWKGVVQGFYSSLLAILLLSGVIYLSRREFPEITELQDEYMMLMLFAGVLLAGILITWASTFFAVSRYLQMKGDRLYY